MSGMLGCSAARYKSMSRRAENDPGYRSQQRSTVLTDICAQHVPLKYVNLSELFFSYV